MIKKYILVTGGGGFIGSFLVNFLATKKYSVLGTIFNNRKRLKNIDKRAKLMKCDIRKARQIEQLINKYQPAEIYHLAAQSFPTISWQKPKYTIDVNVNGTINLYESIRQLKEKKNYDPKVVLIGSSAQYGYVPVEKTPVAETMKLLPLHPYGISKVAQELLALQYFRNFGIKSVIIRTFNTTGPGKTNDVCSDFTKQAVMIKKKLKPAVFKVGNLEPKRAIMDVFDVVFAFYLAMEKGKVGEVYNVCGDKPYKIKDVLTMVMEISAVKARILVDKNLLRPTDEPIIWGDSNKFKKQTGWKQKIMLDHTIGKMLNYWENHYGS